MLMCVAKYETLKDLILEARRKYRATNTMVGDAVGVGDQPISDFLVGKVPRPVWIKNWEKLQSVLHVEYDRLKAAVENSMSEMSGDDIVDPFEQADKMTRELIEFKKHGTLPSPDTLDVLEEIQRRIKELQSRKHGGSMKGQQ